ncbi:MAG: transporter substrate-binding domain-containing protein [Legionella sp.]
MIISTLAFSSPLIVGVGVSGAPIAEKVNTTHGSYDFGFCIDLMNEICKRMKISCSYHDINLKNQFALLDSGKIDVLILARPYMPYDLKQYDISIPYAASKIQFVTLKNSSINHISDIKDKKIGVIKSTFYDLLIQSPYGKHNQIIPYTSVPDLLTDLMYNNLDAIVMNHVIAYSLANNSLYNIKLIEHDLPLGDGYGIIALPDKAALIEQIDKAILSIEQDRTYASIYQKYYQH